MQQTHHLREKRVPVLTCIQSSIWYITHQDTPSVQHKQTYCEIETKAIENVAPESAAETGLARPRMT